MRNTFIALLLLTSAIAVASDPYLPKTTYPVEGISFGSYSNMCQSIVRQLPDAATVLGLHVYTTDKIIGALTAEPAQNQTNAFLHVFTNDEKNWKHTRSIALGKNRSCLGLTGEDIQTLIALLQPHVVGDERILTLRRYETRVEFTIGGQASPLEGGRDVFVFQLEDNKWVFKGKHRRTS